MDGDGIWGRDLEMEKKETDAKSAGKVFKMANENELGDTRLFKGELQKSEIRAGRRACGFEGKLVDDKRSELAERCWEEKARKRERLSEWEKERREFVEKRGT